MERCFRLLAGLFLFVSICSCNFSKIEEFELGQDFVNSNSGVVLIDTMNFYASTVQYDSIITSSLSSLLVGGYTNSYTGTVTCSPHFEINAGSFTIGDGTLIYDSVLIKMNYNGYYIGDTTKLMSFQVRQISQKLKPDDNGYLYNTSSFQLYDQLLGEARFYSQPHSQKDFYVRLSDQLGNTLFKKIIDKNDTVQNSTYFKEYFKGVVLVSGENQNTVTVGFAKDSIAVRIYYHPELNPNDNKDKFYFSFPIDASGIGYNKIGYNSRGSNLELIGQNKNELQSPQTDNQTMIQAGSGIYTKIKIPGAHFLKGYGKNVVFIGAKIQLTPVVGSYSEANPLPDSLSVYVVDRKNRIISQLSNSLGYLDAYKVLPVGFDKVPYYEVDITPFFTSELADPGITNQSLFFGSVASKLGSTVNPIAFTRTRSGKENIKLSVYCYLQKND